jgi:hypothetical protein
MLAIQTQIQNMIAFCNSSHYTIDIKPITLCYDEHFQVEPNTAHTESPLFEKMTHWSPR